MQEPNEYDFNELAAMLCELLGASGEGATRVAATALRNAHVAGVLVGVELAANGMQLAAMLDAEDPQNATSSEDDPVYAGPSIALHDHPSPREAMAAAGWVPRDTGARGHR